MFPPILIWGCDTRLHTPSLAATRLVASCFRYPLNFVAPVHPATSVTSPRFFFFSGDFTISDFTQVAPVHLPFSLTGATASSPCISIFDFTQVAPTSIDHDQLLHRFTKRLISRKDRFHATPDQFFTPSTISVLHPISDFTQGLVQLRPLSSSPANMSNVEAINLSGDEWADEISKPTVAVASGSNAAIGNTQRKLKPNTGIAKKRQRKLTSPVWEYFKILNDIDENGNLVCLCNRCGVKYIAESSHGTGNMLRHGKNCKGHNYKDVGQFILKTGLNGSLGTRATTYKHEEFRELLAIALAKHNLPLQFVEYEDIRACFEYLSTEVKTVCRNTIKSDIKGMYSFEKSKLLDMLQVFPGKIALTSDCWTSVTSDGYISLTTHFVDQNWCKGVESSSSKVDKTADSYMTDFDDFFSCEFTSGG
ncbi:hypothetical protein LXL04_028458 [Taraxacum kok-saghyz]